MARLARWLSVIPFWLVLSCGGGGRGAPISTDADAATADVPGGPELPSTDEGIAVVDSDMGQDQWDLETDQGPLPDTTDAEADSGEGEPEMFPGGDLLVKVLVPSSTGFVATPGSLIVLSGLLLGKSDSLEWQGPGKGGQIEPATFWKTEPLELHAGDNVFVVTASNGEQVATDRVVVTYTPGFTFGGPVHARPDVVFVGEKTDVVFTIQLPQVATGTTPTLYTAGEDLKPADSLGDMLDDGKVETSGDEIEGDQIFTVRASVECPKEGLLYFRAGVPAVSGVSSYVAYSAPAVVECVNRVDHSDAQAAAEFMKQVLQTYKQNISNGEQAARQAVQALLDGNGNLAESGLEEDGYGVWVKFKSGLLGVASLAPDGLRSQPTEIPEAEIQSKKSAIFSPYPSDMGPIDEVQNFGNDLEEQLCPTFEVEGPYVGQKATVKRLRAAVEAGIVAIATHGDTFFTGLSSDSRRAYGWFGAGAQEVLFTGQAVEPGALATTSKTCSEDSDCPGDSECVITKAAGTNISGVCLDRLQADLRRGRVAIGPGYYAVLPKFFSWYARGKMPRSLVYLGACRTLYNGTLAAAFLAGGAAAIAGFTDYVSAKFAGEVGGQFLEAMLKDKKFSGDAVPEDVMDPEHEGTAFGLFGASRLSITNANIVNQDFESGDLAGWTADGDGRVITRLGGTGPVRGKFMGIISTGLGYTVQTGSIEQTFCIPEGTYGFSFYWRFYSEEFHEFCGTQFQDTFVAKFVTNEGGEVEMVNVAVDDLCDPDDCSGCCDSGKCVGLVPADVQFDQGDNHMIPKWQKSKVQVSDYAGKGPVTLTFFATDKGDSIYDTAILVDALTFY